MDRETAKQEIRENWEAIIQGITYPARQNVNGQTSYVCPLCGHGEHGDGLTINPRSSRKGALKCFGCGFSGDVLDLLQEVNNCDFNTAFNTAAAELGLIIDYRSSAEADFDDISAADPAEAPQRADKEKGRETPTGAAKAPQQATGAEFGAYFAECRERLSNPAATSYLSARGISPETAAACGIGYDPQADPASAPGAMGDTYRPHPAPRIIIPTGPAHYVGRSIDPQTAPQYQKINSKGSRPGIFNSRALWESEQVFIVEGAFDALSFVEAGAAAVATNSKNNGQALINLLQKGGTKAQQFIICPDNDPNPTTNAKTQQQAQELCQKIQEAGYTCIVYNVAGSHHDANDAIKADRAGFVQRIAEAQEKAQKEANTLPGLLLYDDLLKEFAEADDDIIELPSFPEFSKTAKIKVHSTVAIAADTGGGKSSLAINFVNDLNGEYPCIYFNLEMDRITVLRRLVAIQSGLELDKIEGYKSDRTTAAAVNSFLKAIANRQPLQVVQNVYQLEEIEAIIKKSTAGREAATMIFIDHSLLIEIGGRVSGRYERFTEISERLRKMALKYNIVLFVLLQQNRDGKRDDDERPKNSSLKESGSWENDATHIIFLWYDPMERRKKLIMTKHRGGESGEFALNYWSRTQTYTEAKDQPARTPNTAAGRDFAPPKPTKREKQQEKLRAAFATAAAVTDGKPTLRAVAEAADVTTATVNRWIKEYGGCMIDGVQVDPAGIDTAVEYNGFIKLTPADDNPFEDQQKPQQEGNGKEITAQF